MSDLISRQAALDEFVDGRDVYDIMESIESLPSADIEEDVARRIATIIENEQDMRVILKNADRPTGWIPVSDRLPIPPTFCLVTTDGSHGDVIDIALYMSDGWHKASEVLAWMPLPEPYKGGDSDG